MFRLLIVATVVLASAATLFGQATTTLRIKAILVDADQTPTPVPRHALLISDDPPSAAPRRIFTGVDGTVAVTLRPGRYTVESDAPVMFGGKAYQWTVMVDVPAAGGATLDLTQQDAEIVSARAPNLVLCGAGGERSRLPPHEMAEQRRRGMDRNDACVGIYR